MRKVVMKSQKQTQRRVTTHTPALFIPGGKPALRRAAAFLSAAALLALAGAAPSLPAAAGPDDGKIVTTKGHVDAPKAYWDEQTPTNWTRPSTGSARATAPGTASRSTP